MREEHWQPMVALGLARSLDLRQEAIHFEVPTRDGSRIDLLYVAPARMVGFELKLAEGHQAATPLDTRAIRQLRHFAAVCDELYLVTIGAPRRFTLAPDGRTLNVEPCEVQLTPAGVGWVAFDVFSLEAAVIAPAQVNQPIPVDRAFVVDHLLGRLGRLQRAIQECRT